MASNFDKVVLETGPQILDSLDEQLSRTEIVSPENFDKGRIMTAIMETTARALGIRYAFIEEYRLAAEPTMTLDDLDDGVALSFERFQRLARSVDPGLSDDGLLNAHPLFYTQSIAGWLDPASRSWEPGGFHPDVIVPHFFFQARGFSWYAIEERRGVCISKNRTSLESLLAHDIQRGKLRSVDELLAVVKKGFRGYWKERGRDIEDGTEEENGFWEQLCDVIVPIVAVDKGEEVVLGLVGFDDIPQWDLEPLSDEVMIFMQKIANKIARPVADAMLAHQWKKQNAALTAAQAKIVEQEKVIVEQSMAGGFAHEIRNALSPIGAYIAVLLGTQSRKGLLDAVDFAEEDKQMLRDRLLKVRNQAEYALDITGMIMEYAKIESQRAFKEVKIKDLLVKILGSRADELKELGITVTSSLMYEGSLHANPTQVRQVAENLLLNAEHAVEEAERKEIALSCEYVKEPDKLCSIANSVRIAVSDSGCGIDDAIKDKIFRPFFTTRPDKKGAGLGLATSRRIARLYGGDLTFDSAPGRTVFTFSFPVGEQKEMEARADER